MNYLTEFYIIGGTLAGTAFGALAAVLYYRARLRRIEKETWRSAATYYGHRNQPEARRI